MDLGRILPPSLPVQRRGWEAALVLTQDYRGRLAQHEAERMAWVVAKGPERLTCGEIKQALRLHAAHVVVRQ